ncbi:hypothetical protein SynA1528_00456 [Synechococcus sp. A15-28]|nr:hypothetical protein SynA1528_00456 [Synechococcus sp. A15-28]
MEKRSKSLCGGELIELKINGRTINNVGFLMRYFGAILFSINNVNCIQCAHPRFIQKLY